MCNANKHPPGCECGFGPPYPPSYSSENVTEWARQVVDRPDLIERGLRESAWDQDSIDEFIQAYQQLRNDALPPDTLASRIKQLLGMRRQVVEYVSEDWINVPLYRFGAPNVADAKVQYSEGEGIVRGSGWCL